MTSAISGSSATIARIIVSVSNLGVARRFYEGVLGLGCTRQSAGFAYLATGEGIELLLHERPAKPSDAAVAMSFKVADVDDAVARAVAVGAKVIDAPEDKPWGERLAVLRDPDGHVVCLAGEPARAAEPS